MNDYQKNLAIYQGLVGFAKCVLNNSAMPVGKYTAKQVAKSYMCPQGHNMCSVTVGSFTCEVREDSLFYALDRFEKLIKPCNRVIFERVAEKGTPILEFAIPKGIKSVFKAVEKGMSAVLRPQMAGVCLDTETGALVGSDGSKLTISSVEVTRFADEEQTRFVIPVEAFKGAEKIVIEKIKDKFLANGIDCINLRYPNFSSVIPQTLGLHVPLKKWSDLTKAAKAAEKLSGSDCFTIKGMRGEKKITVESESVTKNVELSACLAQDVEVKFKTDTFKNMASGELYINRYVAMTIGEGILSMMCVKNANGTKEMLSQDDANTLMAAGIWKKECRSEFVADNATTLPAVVAKYENATTEIEEEETATIIDIKTSEIMETKNLPAIVPNTLPAVVAVEIAPVAPIEDALIEDVEIIEEVAEEVTTEIAENVEEPQTVNGMAVGDYVTFKINSGDTLTGKICNFSKNLKKARVIIFGWNKISLPIEALTLSAPEKMQKPSWLKPTTTITNGEITSEISIINRSKVVLADTTEINIKNALLKFRPLTAEEIKAREEAEKPSAEVVPIKGNWFTRLLKKVALFSF